MLEWVQPSHLGRAFVCALHPKQMRNKASMVPENTSCPMQGTSQRHIPVVAVMLGVASWHLQP